MDATDQASIEIQSKVPQPYLIWTEDMKGFLRALLFGAGLSLALIALVPIFFWLAPEIAPPADRTWAVGAASAFALFASAMAVWKATRLPASSSWLIAIVGWIVGFNLAIFLIEIVFVALLSGR